MLAYIDETGNTGANLFDPNQPIFMTAALMTQTNFDVLYKGKLKRLAKKLGVEEIHANELGLEKIDEIALDILGIFEKAIPRFFMSRIIKIDHAVIKLVDTIFDSGENLSVPWHAYNLKPLRLLLVLKIVYLLDEEIVKIFWESLMERNIERAYNKFQEVLSKLLPRIDILPDERSRELIREAMQWALDNPEAIHLHLIRKQKDGHLPNLAAFPSLLSGIEKTSKYWKRPVREIKHDRQSQFEATLKEWHEITSNASPEPLNLPLGEKLVLRSVFGSKFIISSAAESAGIQIIDIILWLLKKAYNVEPLPHNCVDLIKYVSRRGEEHEVSLESISGYLSKFMPQLEAAPISEEQMAKAHELLGLVEENRQEKMLQYSEQKLLSPQK